jgi:hypothetical protein
MALWASALHSALDPQIILSHGSMHSLETHALVNGQSSSTWHSYWKHSSCGLPAQLGGHLHTGRWAVVLHTAPLPHGWFKSQGSRHWFSIQALLSGHSISCWHSPFLIFVHWRYGSPSKPGGQEQVALWFLVEQIAVWLHGLSVMQGLMQLLLRQAWLAEHSVSDEQPIGWGATKKTILLLSGKLSNNFYKKVLLSLLILSHRTSPFPVKPGKQIQLIVLSGKELCTTHSAFGAHGWITLHGFSQSPLKHACLLGHSRSSLQPGSGGGGTKNVH